MTGVFRSNRSHPTRLARRVALLALMVLEITIALAPLMEPHHAAPESHIEPTGTTHIYLVHDEATCPVCTLRSIRALPSTASAELFTLTPAPFTGSRHWHSVVTRDGAAHSTRAPPALS
jgi:hypothetical protein